MKKIALALPLLALLFSCGSVSSETSTYLSSSTYSSSSSSSSSLEGSSSSSLQEGSSSSSDSSNSSESSSSSSDTPKDYLSKTLKEVNDAALLLDEDEIGDNVIVYGTYVKKIYDNGDMLMLILNGEEYLYIRFSSSQWTTHVNNIYFDTALGFKGAITKRQAHPEIILDELVESSIPSCSYDIDKISTDCKDIASVYSLLESIVLSNKYNGVGGIVSFQGQAMASDRSDSNKKAVVTDGNMSITLIGGSKLLSKEEIGNHYQIIGSLSIDRSSPAILVLSFTKIEEAASFDSSKATEVLPCYFAKWNTLSDHFSAPTMSDYGKLYKTTCYIGDDSGHASSYYLGGVDKQGGDLNDVGVSTSIKGFFLMNELNLSETDLSYSAFYEPFSEAKQVSFVFSMYKFETNWHGWKMFAFEPTIVI